MSGFDNEVMYAKNADFTSINNQNVLEANGLATDGQLWIGRTAVNAGGTHIDVNTLTAGTGITITNGPGSISIGANGSVIGQTITGDTGGALSPTAGNWNILGQQANTTPVMDTIGTAPSTLRIEDRTWQTQYVVDASSTAGLRGTFTTIQAAINQAVADGGSATKIKTIFIRPGSYIEDLVMPANSIHLTANTPSGFNAEQPSPIADVTIGGVITFAVGAAAYFSNLNLASLNSSPAINATNTTTTIVCTRCSIISAGNTAISATATIMRLDHCDVGSQSISVTGSSGLVILDCTIPGLALTDTTLQMFSSNSLGITTAGNCNLQIRRCTITGTIAINSTSISTVFETNLTSTTSNIISGAGSITYGDLIFPNALGNTISVTTQTPIVRSNDAIKVVTPGAYPYTTIPQDAVILVDTSAARTITPLASPTTGQIHTIKDSVGSAATNAITITPSGKNIDGAASRTINSNYGSITLVYNGTEWSII